MVRLLAFALHANEKLHFTKGLSTDEEPDLWQRSLTNEIEMWIDVGLPDVRRQRKACSRAKKVILYIYGGRGADLWWQRNGDKLQRFGNLSVGELPEVACKAITGLVQRDMQLQCTIQDGEIWLTNGESTCSVPPLLRKAPIVEC